MLKQLNKNMMQLQLDNIFQGGWGNDGGAMTVGQLRWGNDSGAMMLGQ